jgi:hypothetical protein
MQAEADGFSELHLYVCCAFLKRFAKEIKGMNDFQELILFLQHVPTGKWREADMELVLAEAFVLKSMYHDAPHHVADARDKS